jgi:hypothetical protein
MADRTTAAFKSLPSAANLPAWYSVSFQRLMWSSGALFIFQIGLGSKGF